MLYFTESDLQKNSDLSFNSNRYYLFMLL